MYQPVPGNRRVVTKLLKNYRSHEEILRLPNEMFYKSELQVLLCTCRYFCFMFNIYFLSLPLTLTPFHLKFEGQEDNTSFV